MMVAEDRDSDLAAAYLSLAQANDDLKAFSYTVSHDLRAPLRAIDGFTRLLIRDHADTLPPEAREHLERVRAATVRMGALIDGLLSLSRMSRQPVTSEDVDITALARTVTADLAIAEPGRSVTVDVTDGLRATGDPRLLEIVLLNLLGNAWKFTAGRADAHICVRGRVRAGERVFMVEDNGCGFDPAYSDKLFRLFQRLHRSDEFPGEGIGLASVHQIVRRHGGRVWAEGTEGAGAKFFFSLPRS